MANTGDENLQRDYCAGVLSLRELAGIYGITEGAIRKRAKKFGWVRRKKTEKKNGTQVRKNGTQKKMRTAKDNGERTSDPGPENVAINPEHTDVNFFFDPAEFGLTERQALFVYHYIRTKNRTEAYRQSGYQCTGNAAYAAASQLYRNIRVSRAIRTLTERAQKRYTAELDELVHQLVAIIRSDPNEISQYRRVNCRHCWGDNHLYQWRDIGEYDAAAERAAQKSKPAPEYGGLGFVDNADPNPDCPRCNGEGHGEIFVADTRDLDGDARHLFSGVRQTKNGIEVLTEDKRAARAQLIQLITKLDLNNQNDIGPQGLNDFYADIRKTNIKPSST